MKTKNTITAIIVAVLAIVIIALVTSGKGVSKLECLGYALLSYFAGYYIAKPSTDLKSRLFQLENERDEYRQEANRLRNELETIKGKQKTAPEERITELPSNYVEDTLLPLADFLELDLNKEKIESVMTDFLEKEDLSDAEKLIQLHHRYTHMFSENQEKLLSVIEPLYENPKEKFGNSSPTSSLTDREIEEISHLFIDYFDIDTSPEQLKLHILQNLLVEEYSDRNYSIYTLQKIFSYCIFRSKSIGTYLSYCYDEDQYQQDVFLHEFLRYSHYLFFEKFSYDIKNYDNVIIDHLDPFADLVKDAISTPR